MLEVARSNPNKATDKKNYKDSWKQWLCNWNYGFHCRRKFLSYWNTTC